VRASEDDEVACNFFGGIDVTSLFIVFVEEDEENIELLNLFLGDDFKLDKVDDVEYGGNNYLVFFIEDKPLMLLFQEGIPCVILYRKPDFELGASDV